MSLQHTLARPPAETPKLRETDGEGTEALVYAHYFLPSTRVDIFVTEYDPEEDIIFGWTILDNYDFGEFGYTSMKEIEELEINAPIIINGEKKFFPVRVEMDMYWLKKPIREAIGELDK